MLMRRLADFTSGETRIVVLEKRVKVNPDYMKDEFDSDSPEVWFHDPERRLVGWLYLDKFSLGVVRGKGFVVSDGLLGEIYQKIKK